jgi:hypothetical protein
MVYYNFLDVRMQKNEIISLFKFIIFPFLLIILQKLEKANDNRYLCTVFSL